MTKQPPGPPLPPITPGANGWPSREKLRAMVATLGVFEWCEANGLLEEWSGELRRARGAFMFAHGPTAERWREQTDEEPSWSQYASLIRDNERLRAENQKLRETAGNPAAFVPDQMVSARDFQRSIDDVIERLRRHSSLLVLKRGEPVAVLSEIAGRAEGKGSK